MTTHPDKPADGELQKAPDNIGILTYEERAIFKPVFDAAKRQATISAELEGVRAALEQCLFVFGPSLDKDSRSVKDMEAKVKTAIATIARIMETK